IESQLHGVDRDARLVAQHIMAACAHVAAFGNEVDLNLARRDARLRRIIVTLVQALIFGASMAPLIGGRKAIENVGVVEQETAETDEGQRREGTDATSRATEAAARQLRAPTRMRFFPAHPEQIREHGEEDRERAPIQLPVDEWMRVRPPPI